MLSLSDHKCTARPWGFRYQERGVFYFPASFSRNLYHAFSRNKYHVLNFVSPTLIAVSPEQLIIFLTSPSNILCDNQFLAADWPVIMLDMQGTAVNPDCQILNEWLPSTFTPDTCCDSPAVVCLNNRVIVLQYPSATNWPPSLAKLDALTSLDLSHGSLSGPIPPAVLSLTRLSSLVLSHNALNGTIPKDLCNSLIYLESMQVVHITAVMFPTTLFPAPSIHFQLAQSLYPYQYQITLFKVPLIPSPPCRNLAHWMFLAIKSRAQSQTCQT